MRCNVPISTVLGRRRADVGVRMAPVALAALLGCASPTCSAQAVPAAQYRIDEPARPLSDTLRAIARQTGVSVLFDPLAVSGRQSRPVSGQMSAVQAMTQVLEGSGLSLEVMPDGVVVVGPLTPREGRQAMPARRGASGPGQDEGAAASADTAPVRLAQAPAQPEGDAGAPDAPQAGAASPPPDRIEITGSRLRRIDAEGALPVKVYGRDDIDRSGQPTLERFLSSLNEASVSPGEGSFGGTTGQGTVQLRGLPLGSTLVLVNGRRVQAVGSSSGNLFNLNLIPMAAVERVEVVPVGSSAVYGGDALAGVVNVILKKSVDGLAVDARLGTGKGFGDGSFSLAGGGSGENGSFLLLGSYSKATPLTMAEREFFTNADYRRFGGRDVRTRSCTPGTVASATAANLPGLNAAFAAIPAAAAGQPLAIADFAATAGRENLCNGNATGQGGALVHGTQALGLHALGERRFSAALSAFGELTHTRDRLRAEESGLSLNNVLVPASNPYNPFGVAVRVTARLGPANGLQTFERATDYTRVLAGLRGALWAGWDFEAVAATSRDKGTRVLGLGTVNVAARTAALAASAPAAALNPFTTGRAASDEVLGGIWTDALRHNKGRKDLASAFARGAVAELPAGPVEAIVGAEHARDRYESIVPADGAVRGSRESSAVFGEFVVPLARVGESRSAGWTLAAVTLAGRRDRYSDFGSAGTYQAGLEVRPARTLLLRGALATSFKPPTLLQTNVDDFFSTSEAFALVDPARNNAPILGADVVRGTNRALHPEEGRAQALGAVWEPAAGTRVGVSAWRIRLDGLISLMLPQVALNNEASFPGFVTRGPSNAGASGPVTRVLFTEVNFGRVETAGTDFEGAYSWQGPLGRWTAGASATRTSRYSVVVAPGVAEQQRLGRRYLDYWAPQWKGRLSAGVDQAAWNLGFTSRYLGSYKDAGTSERRLGDFWVHDLAAGVDLGKLGLGLGPVKTARVSLAVANLAGRQPQFVETSPYFDLTQADWRGRYASVRLAVNW